MTRHESRDIDQLIVERTARAATRITSKRDTADGLAWFDCCDVCDVLRR